MLAHNYTVSNWEAKEGHKSNAIFYSVKLEAVLCYETLSIKKEIDGYTDRYTHTHTHLRNSQSKGMIAMERFKSTKLGPGTCYLEKERGKEQQ